MEHRDWKNSLQETAGRHASRRGAFSAGLTALAVAAVLVFNLLAAQLPEQWAQIDLTGSGIYNISETSQDYLAGLEDDVVIHVLTDGGIPEDCSLLILNEPDQDLADDELDMILNYLAEGGQVIYNMAGELVDLPNFNALCAAYGMQVADGMIADTSQGYQNNPYLFFAQADTSVDAASSLTSDSMVLFYASRGFTLADPTRDTITVQPFLTTTENGYAVLDADNMTQGTYVVGAVATEEISEDTTARLTVYGADTLINTDVTNSFTNVDNVDLFIHSATVGFDDVSAISVEPVSLLTPTNTITTGGIWGLLFILVIPAALLIYGFVRWMHRRKL